LNALIALKPGVNMALRRCVFRPWGTYGLEVLPWAPLRDSLMMQLVWEL
jgi:hypothetical protein